MLCVVLDTNIIISALWSKVGIPSTLLDMVLDGKLMSAVSQEVLYEYKDVLSRDKFRHRFTLEVAMETLSVIDGLAIHCVPPQSYFPQFTDETDRKFYDLAKTANAYLITGNIKHYPQNEKIITPADFLKLS